MNRRAFVEALELAAGAVALVAGGYLLGQGSSFLRPAVLGGGERTLAAHATAFAIAGLAIACLAFLGLRTRIALARLEARRRLEELARNEPPEREEGSG
ncbi:MAG: hypothetical protein KJ058_00685 [Thermoanaerobaculia bacterium]|nr:hypothetical protein [Thermoanaerobaculia bacterium]MCZ7652259.1 hypothetical protein [Thermoanaerobaculia bacterium]